MTPKTMFKRLGWDSETQSQVDMMVRNTRESMKHCVFGMRQRVFPEIFFIRAIDRHNSRVVADSKDLGDRESQIELYDALVKHYDLPYCCVVHKEELTYLEGFDDYDDEDEEGLGEFGFDLDEDDDRPFGFEDEDDDDFEFDFL